MKAEEKAALQRRIKNQRQALRLLNRQLITLKMLLEINRHVDSTTRTNAYRHAAQLAESIHYWPFGKRIGAYIRRWC